jgi:drug/metabolite transporter (DMT)-like permease
LSGGGRAEPAGRDRHEAARQCGDLGTVLLVLGIGFVIFLNGLRMLVWMFANRAFPLSTMYPLTSIFYPLMLGVSYYFNERITPLHVAGTFFITLGVFWLGWKVKDEAL